MALKSFFLISLLLAGFAAAPTIAQLGGLGNLLGGLINIQDAAVQLQCGDTAVSSSTTNQAGTFTFLLDPLTTLLLSLLNNCKLVVKTPLSACNSTASRHFAIPLQFIGKTLRGILGVLSLGPTGFSFIPSN